ncbi:MAG: IS110 family transposase [Acetobacteraceae bacterium]|nr:IS110 family transposase [Acetobacteraceae bacterium]
MAEIGPEMSRFPTQAELISWAGLCPRNDESAGKRRSNRMRKRAQWLKRSWCCAQNGTQCLRIGNPSSPQAIVLVEQVAP